MKKRVFYLENLEKWLIKYNILGTENRLREYKYPVTQICKKAKKILSQKLKVTP